MLLTNETADPTCFPIFSTSATGDRELYTNSGLLYNSATNSLTASTITSSVATGTAPFTVTSTTPVANLSVATAGTAVNLSGTQIANYVYAAPNGSAGTASFRALLASDIPTLNQNTTGTAANLSGSQTANTIYAAPNGSAGTALFRTLASADIPDNAANTSGTSANLSGIKTANTVYAAPNGSAGTASFRALLAADIPTLNQNTTGTSATVTDATQTAITSVSTGTSGLAIAGTGPLTIGGYIDTSSNIYLSGAAPTIEATGSASNINMNIKGKGTGAVTVGTGSSTGIIQSNGNYDLKLQTGNATTGSITMTNGSNGNINITPNGSGNVIVDTSLNVTGNVSISGTKLTATSTDASFNRISVVSGPTNANDVATKSYVDAHASGLVVKPAVIAATTANIASLSGLLTIDTVTVAAGNRVLVKDQSTPTQNGIYVAASGAWTRAADFDVGADVYGAYTFIQYGSVNINDAYTVYSNTSTSVIVGTDPVNFTLFSSATHIESINKASSGNGDDLTITLTGAYDSSILLNSSGTGSDAIGLTASTGGINLSANVAKGIYLNSNTTCSNYIFSKTLVTSYGSAITTVTYAPEDLIGGLIIHASGAASNVAATLPTASSLFGLIPNCAVGTSFQTRIKNNNTNRNIVISNNGTTVVFDETTTPISLTNREALLLLVVCTNAVTPVFTCYSLGHLAH